MSKIINISWGSTVEGAGNIYQAIVEAQNAINESGTPQILGSYLDKISPLLNLLDSPFAKFLKEVVPIASQAIKLSEYILKEIQGEPDLIDTTFLVTQFAYLKSLQDFLKIEHSLSNFPKKFFTKPLSRTIRNWQIELDEKESKKALVCFHRSSIAKKFNEILITRLEDATLSKEDAEILAKKVSRSTFKYLKEAFIELGEPVKKYSQLYANGWDKDLEKNLSFEDYLEEVISPKTKNTHFLDKWKLFDEKKSVNDEEIPVTLLDIYVPLKVEKLDTNGHSKIPQEHEDLHNWSKEILLNETQSKVMFVQGEPGRGKSAFCKVFANWVRESLYPIWIPILIYLKDIKKFENNFEETLKQTISRNFVQDKKWLRNPNTKFLFILDGFDELILTNRDTGVIKNEEIIDLISQIKDFQKKCQRNHAEMGHKILVTGRTLALQAIERSIADNILERVAILPLDEKLQEQWLRKWVKFQKPEKQNIFSSFTKILKSPQVKDIAKEPLLLYLLAAMYRDEKLTVEAFENSTKETSTISLYEQAIEWVLAQRPEWLKKYTEEARKRVLEELALCIIQSGGDSTTLDMVISRLKDNVRGHREQDIEVVEEALEQCEKGDSPVRTTLVCFYIQAVNNRKYGSVEFTHKSFGEFLFASRLKEALEDLILPAPKKRSGFYISDPGMDWQIIDLLGYGELTPEIVAYLMELLFKNIKPDGLVTIFQRLERFYLLWSQGKFIESSNINEQHPLRKSRQLEKQGIYLGQRQIDIYAGLNVLILLLSLHNNVKKDNSLRPYISKMTFYPCGKHGQKDFDRTRLLRISEYSNCFKSSTFVDIVGKFLTGANLVEIDLSRVNLQGANLSKANLSQSDLRRADLSGANLSGAIIRNAYLRGIDMSTVNLSNANLYKSDLARAYLYKANLSGAKLHKVDFRGADLTDTFLGGLSFDKKTYSPAILKEIKADSTTKWFNSRGLHKAEDIPRELKQQEYFKDAVELSKGIEYLIDGNTHDALQIYNDVDRRITERYGDRYISANILNKICWLSCLHGFCNHEIVKIGSRAVQLKPDLGNYHDTLGVALAMCNPQDNKYEAIEHFRIALSSEDFKSLPPYVKERRKRWIDKLQGSQDPFTTEELQTLLREESSLVYD